MERETKGVVGVGGGKTKDGRQSRWAEVLLREREEPTPRRRRCCRAPALDEALPSPPYDRRAMVVPARKSTDLDVGASVRLPKVAIDACGARCL